MYCLDRFYRTVKIRMTGSAVGNLIDGMYCHRVITVTGITVISRLIRYVVYNIRARAGMTGGTGDGMHCLD